MCGTNVSPVARYGDLRLRASALAGRGQAQAVAETLRPGATVNAVAARFKGIFLIDGYTDYNRLTKPSRKGDQPIIIAHCWAYARRKLKEIFDRDGSEIAAEGLRRIAELYVVE